MEISAAAMCELDAVLAESAAEVAGLRAGDEIVRVDGEPVDCRDAFKRYLQRAGVRGTKWCSMFSGDGQEMLITRVQVRGGLSSLAVCD